jgi:hypothetical protein
VQRDVDGAERAAYEHIFRASAETIKMLTDKGLLALPHQLPSNNAVEEPAPPLLFGFSY